MRNKTIEINNLSIGYKGKNQIKMVASDISAKLYSGELTCLLGANGVGKSTLLKTLAAFLPKLDGKIMIQGKDIDDYTEKQLAKTIGVVLTDKCDIRNITVTELVGYGRSPYTDFWGTLQSDDKKAVDDALKMIKIESFADRMIQTLSDGERQKVMIAKALAQSTPIIYLDEPTAFLDYPSKVEIMQLLSRLSRETGKTIFMSTHDLELALQISDKVWLMDKGDGIRIGTPEDLSLDGSIGKFFARKEIVFDIKTGLFRIENDCNRKVRLVGHGPKYSMVQKALHRNGILADFNLDSVNYIDTGKENDDADIIIHINDTEQHANSIDKLLETIDYGSILEKVSLSE